MLVKNSSDQIEIQTHVYDSFGKLASLQSEWDEFVESVGCDIFLTYDWCRLWWKYYGKGRRLCVFVFHYQGKLAGLIPMYIEKLWLGPVYLRIGKIIGTDFTSANVIPPIIDTIKKEIIQNFYKYTSHLNWDVLYLGPIAGIYKNFNEMHILFQGCFGPDNRVRSREKFIQTYFLLSDNDEKIVGLSKKQQRNTRQKYKVLRSIIGNDNAIVSSYALSDNVEYMFDDFFKMHQKLWQKKGKSGYFEDWPKSRQFHFEVAREQQKHNRLRLLQVNAGTIILGYKYAYKFGNTYVEYLDARLDDNEFARAGLGRIIFSEQLEKALQDRVKYIDSLCGKYDHKLRLGGKTFPIHHLFVYSGKLGSRIRSFFFCILAWLLCICYYKIWFYRVAPRFPFRRRPLWKIWVRTQMFT